MNKKLSDDIDNWLNENHELMDDLATIEEKEKTVQVTEQKVIASFFPIEDESNKFKKYYKSETGNKKEYLRRRTPEARYAKARFDAGRRFSGAKEFTLTLQEYTEVITQPCFYCNCNVNNFTGSGLDRMVNEQGYTKANVVSCCPDCNRRRSKSMSSEEFLRQTILNGRRKE